MYVVHTMQKASVEISYYDTTRGRWGEVGYALLASWLGHDRMLKLYSIKKVVLDNHLEIYFPGQILTPQK